MVRLTFCLALLSVLVWSGHAYEVPDASVRVFYPKGFEVSIPDAEGISLFAFHGKVNEEFDGLEAGRWARDIPKAKRGRWTFRDRETVLNLGDTLFFWTYVVYNGLGYRQDDGAFVVSVYDSQRN
ncbi:gram-negative bacteria-binding protein 3 [Drosophila pseudoobscura]|uniref:Gram-negative bacteria-binding protein 3 n=1 Tax=Drosophila pseudoobscura pseudoobscura TaxID=46245 RepID=A0A6I8VW23_DROPS|nr:gram-negative bacteria-binding protein 3 [Drosophila pseudoobscura]